MNKKLAWLSLVLLGGCASSGADYVSQPTSGQEAIHTHVVFGSHDTYQLFGPSAIGVVGIDDPGTVRLSQALMDGFVKEQGTKPYDIASSRPSYVMTRIYFGKYEDFTPSQKSSSAGSFVAGAVAVVAGEVITHGVGLGIGDPNVLRDPSAQGAILSGGFQRTPRKTIYKEDLPQGNPGDMLDVIELCKTFNQVCSYALSAGKADRDTLDNAELRGLFKLTGLAE